MASSANLTGSVDTLNLPKQFAAYEFINALASSILLSFIVFKTLGTVNAARADNPAKTTTSSTRVKPSWFLNPF